MATMEEKGQTKAVHFQARPETVRAFKAWCAESGVTMWGKLEEMMSAVAKTKPAPRTAPAEKVGVIPTKGIKTPEKRS
jgi:hypothetical protein